MPRDQANTPPIGLMDGYMFRASHCSAREGNAFAGATSLKLAKDEAKSQCQPRAYPTAHRLHVAALILTSTGRSSVRDST